MASLPTPGALDTARRARLSRTNGWLILAAAATLVALVAARALNSQRASKVPAKEEALPVESTLVVAQRMPVLVEAVGEVIPQHSVQVRPQIGGMLKRVLFTEGQRVSSGQRLFEIEPASFEAAASATRAVAESAKANAERLKPLEKEGYVTAQELINARTTVDQANAAHDQAMINLSYTQIHAPISGRTGALSVKAGNIVGPSDASPLVTINQTQPIDVQFNVPQQTLAAVREQQSSHAVPVRITSEDGTEVLDEGDLAFIDNAVNTRTGTVLLKARMPNRTERLWPGEYVGVRMELKSEPQAIVVPQTAVQAGQDGHYVFVIVDGVVQPHTVKVDREVGNLAVVRSGLAAGQAIVVRVPRGLRSGSHVRPMIGGSTNKPDVDLPSRS